MCVDLPSLHVYGTDVWNRGDFADMLGEDYLGLRELGIAAEFGMSSLSIPKRLLKGKKGKGVVAAYVLSCFLNFCFFMFPLHSLLDGYFFRPFLLSNPSESSFRPFHLNHLSYTFCVSFIPPSLPLSTCAKVLLTDSASLVRF